MFISRNPYSSLNHRQPNTNPSASSLFSSYPGNTDPNRTRPSAHSPAYPLSRGESPYLSSSSNNLPSSSSHSSTFRPATPNSKGQYSTSVLESLEAQNETTATSLLSSKVSQLKHLTIAIGDEIRDSSQLAESLNAQFEGTSVRLKGTMRRMLRMAEKTGVGWKVWVLFFIAVWALFAWVWLF